MSQICCSEHESCGQAAPCTGGGQGRRSQEPCCRANESGFAEPASRQLATELLLIWPLPLIWLLLSSHPPRATVPFFSTCSLSFRQALLMGSICHVWVGRKPNTQRTHCCWNLQWRGLVVRQAPFLTASVPPLVPPPCWLPHSRRQCVGLSGKEMPALAASEGSSALTSSGGHLSSEIAAGSPLAGTALL